MITPDSAMANRLLSCSFRSCYTKYSISPRLTACISHFRSTVITDLGLHVLHAEETRRHSAIRPDLLKIQDSSA
jgi:hypothetical protein